jgi:hypothetical protein
MAVSDGRLVVNLSISTACYLGGIVRASAVVSYIENVMNRMLHVVYLWLKIVLSC